MEFRIEKLEAFKIVGYKIRSTNALMKGMRDCPAFWKRITKANKQDALLPLMNEQPLGLIGASVYNIDSSDTKKFDYYIAVSTSQDTPNDLEEHIVPAMSWAVFPCTRKTNGKTQMSIVTKWAPQQTDYELLNSGYKSGKMKSSAPDLEVYGQGDDVEIWVPIKQK